MQRGALIFVLALIELPFLAFLYNPFAINSTDALWVAIQAGLRDLAPAVTFFIAAMAVLLAPRLRSLYDGWRMAATDHQWRPWLIANIAGFIALAALTRPFNNYGANSAGAPWLAFAAWSGVAIGLYLTLALAMAPRQFLLRTIANERWLAALAAGASALIIAASEMSQRSWNALSEATFHVSAFFLGLVERDVVALPDERVLGAGDFKVNIAAACSGYEGIGLVTAFLAIYLWIFRSVLRFPNAYLVLPIGIVAIWLLNSVRIAALIFIGEHFSADVAVTGFHSQAGWMMFLIVTIGIMLATHRISFFHDMGATHKEEAPSRAFQQALHLLGPFLAMTAAGIIAAAFTAQGYWLYALRVIAISAALLVGWRFYRTLSWRFNAEALAIGVAVGVVWIATDPGKAEASELGAWIAALPPAAAAAWIMMRLFGTIILVPIAEELAFRGYIHRKLIADKFEAVAEGAFAWKAFIISSALFAFLHDRWLSGALAGAAFAIALYRSGKITGAITAHMSANAIIAFWAIAVGQWSLL